MHRLRILLILAILGAAACSAQNRLWHGLQMEYGGNVELTHCFYWKDFLKTTSGQAELTTSHGVVINKNLFVGLGTGFIFYYAHEGIGAHIPVFADFRYSFSTRRWRPFAALKAGSTLSGSCGLLRPAVGIKYAFKEKLGIYLSMGSGMYFGKNVVNSFWCNGLNVSLGIDF